jgi:hypothetical protein
MAQRPARPLRGYRDVGEEPPETKRTMTRTWLILGLLAVVYLGWTLTVYFVEPGLR